MDGGIPFYIFYHSIRKEDHKRSELISFHNMGLGGKDITPEGKGWKIRTLKSIKRMLGHSKVHNLYLQSGYSHSRVFKTKIFHA